MGADVGGQAGGDGGLIVGLWGQVGGDGGRTLNTNRHQTLGEREG